MHLDIWSLNGGRFVGKTLKEEGPTLKWLKGLSDPGAVVPDVLCLQDFRVSLLQHLRPLPHFHFAPMTNHLIWGKRELTGIAIASRYPLDDIRPYYTYGNGIINDLDGVGNDNHRWGGDRAEEADRRVLETEWRVAIAASVCSPVGQYRIATHHGFWVRGGIPTQEQLESTDSLCNFLRSDANAHGGLVYIADCNLDRDGEVLKRYLAAGVLDCLPPEIKTTVAAHHPAARFGAKPDRVMVFRQADGRYPYKVHDVYTDSSPGSDHDMLCATVSKV